MTEYKDFRISVGDDPEHEDLTAEIYYGSKLLAMLTQERGFNEIEIEFYRPSNGDRWTLRLADFLTAIDLAKARLWELRRTAP